MNLKSWVYIRNDKECDAVVESPRPLSKKAS